MKPSSPWSVKGVEPEAREAAKMAARRAGVPLGTWLSQTIRRAASEQLRSGGTPRQPAGDPYGGAEAPQPGYGPYYPPPPEGPPQQGPSQPPPGQPGYGQPGYGAPPNGSAPPGGSAPPPPAPTTQAVLESINNLAARIRESEERTAETLAPLAEKVRDLSEQMDSVKESRALESSPLEKALARMQERIDEMEDGGRARPSGRPDHGGGGRRRQGFLSRLFSD